MPSAHALRLLELCLEESGDPQRLEYRARSLPIYEELDDQLGLADELDNLGIYAMGEGRLREALAYYDRAHAARRSAGDVVGEAAVMNNAAEALLDQGRPDEAVELLQPALHMLRAAHHPRGVAIVLESLGRAFALNGDIDQAVTLLDESVGAADALNATSFGREVRVRKVEALSIGGRDEAALALADALVPLGAAGFEERFVAMLHRLRGWSLLRLGRLDEAEAAIDEALRHAEAISAGYEIALGLRARAEIRRRRGIDDGSDDDAPGACWRSSAASARRRCSSHLTLSANTPFVGPP